LPQLLLEPYELSRACSDGARAVSGDDSGSQRPSRSIWNVRPTAIEPTPHDRDPETL
jgi:hypothetical protein